MAYGQSEKRLAAAVFLDRDGVLNRDPGYVHKAEDLELFPEVAGALRTLKDMGYRLIVVSNQSGIGRGYFASEDTDRFHEAMQANLLAETGVQIDAFYYCPHRPDEDCVCRKPKVALVEKALSDFQVDRHHSWFIGDRSSDVACAKAAAVTPVFLDRKGAAATQDVDTVPNLNAFVELVKKKA